jgi:hypothetical protein
VIIENQAITAREEQASHCCLPQLSKTGILSSLVPISSFSELPISHEQ